MATGTITAKLYGVRIGMFAARMAYLCGASYERCLNVAKACVWMRLSAGKSRWHWMGRIA